MSFYYVTKFEVCAKHFRCRLKHMVVSGKALVQLFELQREPATFGGELHFYLKERTCIHHMSLTASRYL